MVNSLILVTALYANTQDTKPMVCELIAQKEKHTISALEMLECSSKIINWNSCNNVVNAYKVNEGHSAHILGTVKKCKDLINRYKKISKNKKR